MFFTRVWQHYLQNHDKITFKTVEILLKNFVNLLTRGYKNVAVSQKDVIM